MRSVPEWIARHDDQAVPRSVKARVFERYGGCCYLTGAKIQVGDRWDVEHILAICLGGEHRESNLAPALVAPHKIKSGLERKLKTKLDRARLRHLGLKKPRRITRWRRFDGSPVYASRER
jgi:5-methylcytosine-specific restriction protein A